MNKILVIVALIVIVGIVSILIFPQEEAIIQKQTQSIPELRVAFIGDQGLGPNAIAVLELIKDEGAQMVLHQGDFDYKDDPGTWDRRISDVLGSDFPYFASIGHHDVNAWSGYQKKLYDRLKKNPDAKCIGDLGIKSSCTYKGLFFIQIAPGIGGEEFHEPFVPTEYEKDLIRQHRRMGRNQRPSDVNLRNLRSAIKELPEKMGRIRDVIFDPAMDKFFDKKKSIVPHFEEIVYERFAVGYTIMKGNFNETLQLVFDKEMESHMEKLIDWRLQLKRGSASSQVMRILNQNHGTLKEADLKQELLDFGMTWSDSTMLLSEMVRDRFITRSGDTITGMVT